MKSYRKSGDRLSHLASAGTRRGQVRVGRWIVLLAALLPLLSAQSALPDHPPLPATGGP